MSSRSRQPELITSTPMDDRTATEQLRQVLRQYFQITANPERIIGVVVQDESLPNMPSLSYHILYHPQAQGEYIPTDTINLRIPTRALANRAFNIHLAYIVSANSQAQNLNADTPAKNQETPLQLSFDLPSEES